MSPKNECCDRCGGRRFTQVCRHPGCKCHKPTESWEEAFDALDTFSTMDEDEPLMVGKETAKNFIRSTLHSQREELCGRLGESIIGKIEGMKKDEKYWTGNYCGDPVYEEAQGYNQAIDDVLKAIKNND